MRFDNAFLCKNGVVGMQFVSVKKNENKLEPAIISVFHDGQHLRVSEDASPEQQNEALRKYTFLLKRFVRH